MIQSYDMDTQKKFIAYIDELLSKSITLKAISQKTGISYTRIRNIYYPSGTTTAKPDELTALEKAYRSELLIDYSEEDKALIEELRKTVEVLAAQKDGYKKIKLTLRR